MCAAIICVAIALSGVREMNDKEILVSTRGLSVHFPVKKESTFARRRYIHAVEGVSIDICKGEAFGLVGESGCGKSTLANATLGFVRPTSGEVFFDGAEIGSGKKAALKSARLKMQKIFQNPAASLDPRYSVFKAVSEPLRIRGGYTAKELENEVSEVLERVGLTVSDMSRGVTEFSGGQQQRIAIARTLIVKPEYLVCDEPVSALDVSVHAQILDMLVSLQEQLGITYLFISHDLAAVRKLCGTIAIMYLGQIVEYGSAERIFLSPAHPYTRALISAVLSLDGARERIVLKGDAASPIDLPSGCTFAPRCQCAHEKCKSTECRLTRIADDHFCACPYI